MDRMTYSWKARSFLLADFLEKPEKKNYGYQNPGS